MLFISCEEDVEGNGSSGSSPNVDFVSGYIADYFYDLNNESVNAKFLHYRKALAGYSNTIADTTKIDVTKDTINFRTYNEFRLKVPESEIEVYSKYTHFDETNGGECTSESSLCIDIDYRIGQGEHYLIDNLSAPVLVDDGSEDGIADDWEGFSTNTAGSIIGPSNDLVDNNNDGVVDNEQGSPYAYEDLEQSGEYEIFSHQFTSIEKIIWDQEVSPPRYKTLLDTSFVHYEDPLDTSSDSTLSQWEYSSINVVLGVDTPIYNYDSLVYMTNINDFISPDTGIFYLDTLEFIKTNFSYTTEDIEIFQEFIFNDIQVLSEDSTIYRVITDCNQNGQWDAAEPMIADFNLDGDMEDILNEAELGQNYCDGPELDDICREFDDLGNSIWDEAELYYDINANGQYDSSSEFGAEPFEDRNCNGVYDEKEAFIDALDGICGEGDDYTEVDGIEGCDVSNGDIFVQDLVGNGYYDSNDTFDDVGNGIWDDAEYNEGSLFGSKITSTPSNLLFDHSTNPPSRVLEIDEFTEIQDINGNLYKVIDPITIKDSVYQYVPKVDSVITIFSNEVITHFAPDSSKDLEYIITKTRSAYPDPVREGFDVSEYNYNIFNTENHIKELKNPSFFLPYGFYETPEAISDGFWFDVCRDTLDIFLWAEDGVITTSDGGDYVVDELIVNEDSDCDGDGISDNAGNGDYNIEIDYDVQHLDSVMIKTRKVLIDDEGLCLGGLLHVGLDPLFVSNPEDCYKVPSEGGIGAAALDTMVVDCFKITKTMTMTYIGSGVEYGEKITLWLARDLGIVKNYLDIRWSEPFWVDGEQWRPYSRWELVELRDVTNNGMGRFFNKRRVSYDDFKDLIEFNGEPYERRRTAGLHRVKINH